MGSVDIVDEVNALLKLDVEDAHRLVHTSRHILKTKLSG